MSRAIRIHRTGGPEVLSWEEVSVGSPGPGQVRVRQLAIGVNYIDVYHRIGLYPQPLPLTPGLEGAGTIDAVGDGVTHLKAGDRVAYVGGPVGGYAQERILPAERVIKLPALIGFEQAAAMMLKGLTARILLRDVYPLKRGDVILVHAAAGGTGLILCQWASALGATVIGTTSTRAKAEIARANGCHHVIVLSEQDFVVEVERITKGAKLPVVYDSVGQATFLKSLDCLQTRGLMVSFGQASGPAPPVAPVTLSQKGSLYLTRPFLFHYIDERVRFEAAAKDLFAMVRTGKLKISVNHRHRLSDAAEAHRELESRATTGSSILIP